MGYQNILIIKPSSLGDVVHALPVLGVLRKRFPDAEITWLIRREFAPLLSCVQGLDATLLFERQLLGRWYRPSGFAALRDLIGRLRRGHFDLALDLQGLLRTALLGWLSGCPVRVGSASAREGAPLFYTHRVRRPDDSLHMVDLYRAMLQAVGVDDFEPYVRLEPPAAATDAVRALMEDSGLEPGRFAVLIAGAAHETKRWPVDRFAAVAEHIVNKYGLAVAAVGSPGEKKIIAALQQAGVVPIADLCGRTTIPQLVALLAQAALVVSNDTGPGHIAAALRRPTVLIFGPTNPAWVGPYQQPEAIAAVEPQQRGSAIRSRRPAHRIDQVSLRMVLGAVDRQMTAHRGEQHR